MKEDCIEFGTWLQAQGLLFVANPYEWDGEQVWETSDGEWMTMKELYQKFLDTK